jgi:ribose/xylose/arabinose/galactoside ABC-type transport system permease subunit/ABC-type branched-subunit amino acid transport system ATPase component
MATKSAVVTQQASGLSPGALLSRRFTSYVSVRMLTVVAVVAVLLLVLEGTSGGKLFTANNLGGALSTSAEVGFIAIGVTMLMIGGEFDLSVGQTFVAGALTFAALFQPIGIVPALLVSVALGLGIGFINGFITLWFGIPSFITTLGTYYAIAGVILMITNGSPVSIQTVPSSFKVFSGGIASSQAQWQVLWWLGFAAIAAFVLHKTAFGNHVFAVGGSRQAAGNTGVRVNWTKMALFMICGASAAFSGVVLFALYGDVEASAGSGLQLQAIAAAVIGGTALFGGVGTVYGGVLGSFFLGVIETGLVLSGASTTYYEFFVGLVLIGAVVLQVKMEGLSEVMRRLGLEGRFRSRQAAASIGSLPLRQDGLSAQEGLAARGAATEGSGDGGGLGGETGGLVGFAGRGADGLAGEALPAGSDQARSARVPVLELRNVTMRFGPVVAVDNLSLSIYGGEVLALLGDNGAGKSTVVKIISGVYRPTSGEVWFAGKRVAFRSAKDAREAGISTVYQDLALVGTMNVWRNFFLGAEPTRHGVLDSDKMRAETARALSEIGLAHLSSVDQGVRTLSGGEGQALSIGRAVYFEKRLLLLDEPTAALSVRETENVFEYTRRAAASGIAVIVIMHNTQQALEISNRVVVMRHGRIVGEFSRAAGNYPSQDTVNAMISGVA